MAKQSGLGDNLYVDGVDVSGDTGSLGAIGGGPAALEVTGINKSAFERLGGLRNGRIEWSSWLNPDNAHDELSSLPTSQRIVTYCRGTAQGDPAASMVARQIGYNPTRNADASLSIELQAQSHGFGLDWGRLMTAGHRTDSGATNGSSVDFGDGSTNFGLQAFLHVFSFSGTDVTISLEESSDDGSSDAFEAVTGGSFTQITGSTPLAERIETARDQTVERHLRVVTATTGGFSSVEFAVIVTRNQIEVNF